MSQSIIFYLNQRTFELPYDLSLIFKITNKAIQNEIGFRHEYYVNSKVQNETFQSFINYWIDEKNVPEINFDNFWDFYMLNNEFGIMESIIKKECYLDFAKLSILINTDNTEKTDKNPIESYISSHLSHYIKNYKKELQEVPIQNLNNIFNNYKNDLQNHDDAFSFIIDLVKQKNNDEYYILINSLEMNKIKNPENIKNILSNYKEFLGFCPQNLNSIFDRQQEEIQDLKQQLSNKDILNKENEEKIKNLETIIKDNEEQLKNKDQIIIKNEEKIKNLETKIKEEEEQLKNKDQIIIKNEEKIKNLETKIKDDEEKLKNKDQKITKNEEDIKSLKTQIETKNKDIKEFLIHKVDDLKNTADNFSFKTELTSTKIEETSLYFDKDDIVSISSSIGKDGSCKYEHKVNGEEIICICKNSYLNQFEQIKQIMAILQRCNDIVKNNVLPLIPHDKADDSFIENIKEIFDGNLSIKNIVEQNHEKNVKLFLLFDYLEMTLMSSTLKFFKEETVNLINSTAKDLDDFIMANQF
ncbi:hypothetical protein M9Y10_000670 [Tritrichomonas musculus]|uniref:Uncharacterized protein n=1 Tax=Tritrichomonas musculus TaxID=1915356 RepID=A0ABR2L7Z4_9EUKA